MVLKYFTNNFNRGTVWTYCGRGAAL